MLAITPIDINLLITSLVLTPILLAKSPTEIVSPILMRLLMALGTVISVFFILVGATFFSSRHLVKITSFSSSCFLNFFSIFFSRTLRRGTTFSSSINTSTGPLPFFFGFSNSFLICFSGGGIIIFSPGFSGAFGGISFFVSGWVILCLEIIGGLEGTIDGCLNFSPSIVSAAGLPFIAGAAASASLFGIFFLISTKAAGAPRTGGLVTSSFLSLPAFSDGVIKDSSSGFSANSASG